MTKVTPEDMWVAHLIMEAYASGWVKNNGWTQKQNAEVAQIIAAHSEAECRPIFIALKRLAEEAAHVSCAASDEGETLSSALDFAIKKAKEALANHKKRM
jgi:hypothetical protein